uniref:RNA exonuclease 4 n=1 Tax=Biomphalaria glabrata TaxID=6526 RepID=A0A2C9LJR9_BIOGL
MRMLFIVDDNVAEEEFLKNISEHMQNDQINIEALSSSLKSQLKKCCKQKSVSAKSKSVEIKTAMLKHIKKGCEEVKIDNYKRFSRKRKRTCSESLKDELKKGRTDTKTMQSVVKGDDLDSVEVSTIYEYQHDHRLCEDKDNTAQIETQVTESGCKQCKKKLISRKRKHTVYANEQKKNNVRFINTQVKYSSLCSNETTQCAERYDSLSVTSPLKSSTSCLELIEDSCVSVDSELSESRRPKDHWPSEDQDCSLVFGKLFSDTKKTYDLDGNPKTASTTDDIHVDLPDSMYVALDCEMVGVGPKGSHSVLARCSILDYFGNILYDSYIKPTELITDYRTRWSGIYPFHMDEAEPVHEALPKIRSLLMNKVIIGHAVYNDFRVLGLKPQHYMVRDTAQCRRLVQMASLEGRGNSLKKLAQVLLDRPIQVSSKGHCSVEDARATLDLFKLVRKDWEYDLMGKWLKKNSDIYNKLMEQVNTNTLNASVPTPEDFLQDKFWPTEITD